VDIKAYIESGTLEAYALGVLPPHEADIVQANVAQHAELAQELAAIEEAMYGMAQSQAVQPPPAMAQQIWEQLSPAANKTLNKETKLPDTKPTTNTRPLPQPTTQRWKYAAIWVALVASGALNAILWRQQNQQQAQNTTLAQKVALMSEQQTRLDGIVANYAKNKNMMADTAMRTIVMHTVLKGHPMAATLYIDTSKREAYVVMDALPEPPKGMQYQLWAIKDGKPMDMGVLPGAMAGKNELARVEKTIQLGDAYAISLEQEGGSSSPTASQIYVLGKS
jgi:anti-sigma-K factor RskA